MALRLIIEDVDGSTTIVPLRDGTVTIGREADNTIQLTEQNVSRRHAKLTATGEGGWVVQDLSSYNGVQVNNLLVREALQVHEGDLIRIGDYHLALADDEDRQTVDLGLSERALALAPTEVEPMLASSSANLPAISPDELESIRAGEARTVAVGAGETDRPAEPERGAESSGGAGGKIAVGLLLVAAVVAGGWWFSQRGVEGGGPVVAATDSRESASEERASPSPSAAPSGRASAAAGAAAPVDVRDADTEDGESARDSGGGEPEAAVDPAPKAEEPDPPSIGDAESEPDPRPESKTKKPAAAKKKKADASDAPAGEPAVDSEALLADARAAMLAKDWSKAYDLAKRSNAAKKSSGALSVMGLAACKMKQGPKAQAAAAGLSGSKREMLVKACAQEGVEL